MTESTASAPQPSLQDNNTHQHSHHNYDHNADQNPHHLLSALLRVVLCLASLHPPLYHVLRRPVHIAPDVVEHLPLLHHQHLHVLEYLEEFSHCHTDLVNILTRLADLLEGGDGGRHARVTEDGALPPLFDNFLCQPVRAVVVKHRLSLCLELGFDATFDGLLVLVLVVLLHRLECGEGFNEVFADQHVLVLLDADLGGVLVPLPALLGQCLHCVQVLLHLLAFPSNLSLEIVRLFPQFLLLCVVGRLVHIIMCPVEFVCHRLHAFDRLVGPYHQVVELVESPLRPHFYFRLLLPRRGGGFVPHHLRAVLKVGHEVHRHPTPPPLTRWGDTGVILGWYWGGTG
eukprot:Sspe_Gene.17028::Locus_6030_Transcript_1_2_Confidence_0.667_Length_1346::g.17028::m.17028